VIIDYLTIFPEIFPAILGTSILGRARENRIVDYRLNDLRDYSQDKHHTVDDKPFGGEPGMVMMVGPLDNALGALNPDENTAIILTDAAGMKFEQQTAVELSDKSRLVFLCGRYKGVDERIKALWDIVPLSIGNYVVSGGELAALVMTEVIGRLLPGVLGDMDSAIGDSHFNGLLGAPVYTRPSEYKGIKAPEVLLSGNHTRIRQWRHDESLRRTEKIRPDLYQEYSKRK